MTKITHKQSLQLIHNKLKKDNSKSIEAKSFLVLKKKKRKKRRKKRNNIKLNQLYIFSHKPVLMKMTEYFTHQPPPENDRIFCKQMTNFLYINIIRQNHIVLIHWCVSHLKKKKKFIYLPKFECLGNLSNECSTNL